MPMFFQKCTFWVAFLDLLFAKGPCALGQCQNVITMQLLGFIYACGSKRNEEGKEMIQGRVRCCQVRGVGNIMYGCLVAILFRSLEKEEIIFRMSFVIYFAGSQDIKKNPFLSTRVLPRSKPHDPKDHQRA